MKKINDEEIIGFVFNEGYKGSKRTEVYDIKMKAIDIEQIADTIIERVKVKTKTDDELRSLIKSTQMGRDLKKHEIEKVLKKIKSKMI